MLTLLCLIVGNGRVFPVKIEEEELVSILKEEIKKKNEDIILCNPAELILFLAKKEGKADGEWISADEDDPEIIKLSTANVAEDIQSVYLKKELKLNGTWELNEYFKDDLPKKSIHVLVKLPEGHSPITVSLCFGSSKRQKLSLTMMDFFSNLTDLVVKPQECDIEKWASGSLIQTCSIHAVMSSFGGFPSSYYVRQEEKILFEIIIGYWISQGASEVNLMKLPLVEETQKLAIIGSPGVGKSAFLVLLGFYMSIHKEQNILLLRKLKGSDSMVVVFLSKRRFVGGMVDLRDYSDLRNWCKERFDNVWVYFDGFTETDITTHFFMLGSYNILATSSQFRPKSDDPSKLVVLPAWREIDLRNFATCTNLFGKVDAKTSGKRAKDYFFYSGGSLREFCRDMSIQRDRVNLALRAVGDSNQALKLLSSYGGSTSKDVDSLKRHYINDPANRDHYVDPEQWSVMVDASFALRRLISICDHTAFESIFDITRGLGGAFHGWAFEYYLHKLVQSSNGFMIRARSLSSVNLADEITLDISGSAACKGTGKDECLAYLREWSSDGEKRYWYPDYPKFATIDSVAKCKRDSSEGKLDFLAYLQITTSTTHSLNGPWLNELDDVFQDAFKNRAYLAVVPSKELCDKFSLNSRDTVNTRVPLYVGYFMKSRSVDRTDK